MLNYSWFSIVAPYLANPLVLVGFVVLLFHTGFWLLRRQRLSKHSPTASSRVVQQYMRYGFLVAILIIALGFALQANRDSNSFSAGHKTQETYGANSPAIRGVGGSVSVDAASAQAQERRESDQRAQHRQEQSAQKTAGDNSPAISDVKGDVVIKTK